MGPPEPVRRAFSLLRSKRLTVDDQPPRRQHTVKVMSARVGRGVARCESTSREHRQQVHHSAGSLRARRALLHDSHVEERRGARGCSSTAVFRKNRAGGMVNVKVHHQQTTFNKCGPSVNLCQAPPATMARGAPCRHWRDTRARAQVTTSGVLPSTIRSCSQWSVAPATMTRVNLPPYCECYRPLDRSCLFIAEEDVVACWSVRVRSRRSLNPHICP